LTIKRLHAGPDIFWTCAQRRTLGSHPRRRHPPDPRRP
jgi:hypothetical protein